MHVPRQLGTYPLVLRDSSEPNPRMGELMLNYAKYDLIYIDRESGEKVEIFRDVFRKIISTRLQNSVINLIETDETVPAIEDRHMNNWYHIVI